MLRLAALGMLLVAAGQSATPQPVELQPSGPWKVDYADRACTLTRPYAGAGQTYLVSATFEPIEKLVWVRIGSSEKIERRDDGDARIEVDGSELDHKVHYNVFPNLSGGMTREFMFKDFLREIGPTRQTVRLDIGKHGDLRLNASDFPKAMKASQDCVADLHRSLNIDQALLDSIAVKPEGLALRFVDYPKGGGGFDLALLYWVTPAGKVDECKVLVPSGHETFDQTVCQQLKARGRFKPARNAAGEAIRAPVYHYMRLRTTAISNTHPPR